MATISTTNAAVVTAIFTYPIKSCGALQHERITLDEYGLIGDRRWMITDAEGMFYTQREYPTLAVLQPTIEAEALRLSAPAMPDLHVPLNAERAPEREVEVWNDRVLAWDEGDAVAAWVSDYLKAPARLVRMTPKTRREIDPRYAKRPGLTTFADAYPILIAAEESLAELNRRVVANGGEAVPMSRFRPNLVIAGAEPFAEDNWLSIYAGTLTIDVVKPCARCKTTTIDQQTGTIPNKREPLHTLSTFRRWGTKTVFAQNAIHRAPGLVAVGDRVTVLEHAIEPAFEIG
jgi:hypothetical protein